MAEKDSGFVELCLKRRRNEIDLNEFGAALMQIMQDPGQVENIAIDVEALHGNGTAGVPDVPAMHRDDDYDLARDQVAMRDRAVVVRASVEAARALVDQVTDEDLSYAIDEVQGVIMTKEATKAWLVLIVAA